VSETLTSDTISASTGLPIKWIAKHFNAACDGTMLGYHNLYDVEEMRQIAASKLATPRINKNPKQALISATMMHTMWEYLNPS